MLYSIKTPQNQQLKSYIKRYISDIPIDSKALQGTFSITNIRFYKYNIEIEVLFKGKMYGRMGRKPSVWLSSDVLNIERVSKIRINRFIKKSLVNKLETRLGLFDVNLRHYSYIKKLKWI